MAFIPVYILILFFTITVDYFAGILIENANGRKRLWYLVMSIVANIGLLGFFKYYNFFADNVNFMMHSLNSANTIPLLKIILPIGLSFHTFQALSYTIEVYRGNQKAERHYGIYALYVMFYPQLVAGPIERPQNMLHQFHAKHEFSYDQVTSGLRLVLWGIFKKSVIADRIALVVDPVLNNPHQYSPLALMMAVVLFAYEIYCDFSGYSEVALGTARIMGYELMVNFSKPYSSRSISEFWKRWHISLSTWFYDYLFNPIVTALRNWRNGAIIIGLFFTFLVSGLWHGAAWHYILWGGLHGAALTYEALTRKKRKRIFKKIPQKLGDIISIVCTFTYVCFGYIFFRANNLKDAFYITKKMPGAFVDIAQIIRDKRLLARVFLHNIPLISVCVCIFWIIFMEIVHFLEGRENNIDMLIIKQPKLLRWAIYLFFTFSILEFGVFDNKQFIYFQF